MNNYLSINITIKKCTICKKTITGDPYKVFGELNYCSRKCWLNTDKNFKEIKA